jgi:hypothetical protein
MSHLPHIPLPHNELTAEQQQIQQMQAAMQQMHSQLLAVQQQLQVTTAPSSSTLPAAASPSLYAPRSERPRLPPPATYDGKSSTLDDWVVEVNQQFDWYGTANEVERLRVATAFLKGAARDWWVQLPSSEKSVVHTWELFVDALRRRFQPVTTAELARAKLSTLSQGRSTVHDYVAAFRRLMISLPSMEEGDRLFAFIRGLKSSIGTQLRVHGVKTVDAAIEMAVRVGSMGEFAALSNHTVAVPDPNAMELDAIEGLEPSSTSASSSSVGSPITRGEFQQLLAAMSDARKAVGPRKQQQNRRPERREGGLPRFQVNGLTPEQVREHLDNDSCFYCHAPGHQSRKCPKKAQDESNGSSSKPSK